MSTEPNNKSIQTIEQADTLLVTVPKDSSSKEAIIIKNTKSTIQIIAEENSNSQLILLHENEQETNIDVQVKNNAELSILEIILNKSATSNLKVELTENNAKANVSTIFLASTDKNINIKTTMHHSANETDGNMVCRGVLLNNAKADFEGNISIPQNIKDVESHQNMKCLTQGDSAICNALPILDVTSDSVVCSHGAAIGRVEDESLYYLQSRGISKEDAMSMLLEGFLLQEASKFNLTEEFQAQIKSKIKLILSNGDSNE